MKTTDKGKPMNLDKLAAMVQTGFGDVKSDVQEVDKRLRIVETNLDKALIRKLAI